MDYKIELVFKKKDYLMNLILMLVKKEKLVLKMIL